MKKIGWLFLMAVFGIRGFGQSQEMQQLKLDLEKLVQMKMMLNSLYDGYATLVNGYNQISSEVKGSFDLHKNYLDGLLQVADPVQHSPLIQSITEKQLSIAQESQTAYGGYVKSGVFSAEELVRIKERLDEIGGGVAKKIKQLQLVLAPGALRMSDEERIAAIDRIDRDVGQALASVRAIVKEENTVAAVRVQKKRDINALRRLYGLKN